MMKPPVMKYLVCACTMLAFSHSANAALVDVFKDEFGRTKWQHVANFSGSVLIILLTVTLISLAVSRFRIRQRNNELKEIKKHLEETVEKRTENLNKSNRLLQESNKLLEGEIAERRATSALLLSSQAYLKSILASMPSMLIGLNEHLEITQWNDTAETITGQPEDSVMGKNLWDVYPGITVAPEQVEAVLKSGKPDVVKHSQRGQYYFDITLYPLSDGQKGVVLVVENVTQRSLAENMLIQRDKMASMGELASTMAYDINTPLQGILADVQGAHDQLSKLSSVPQSLSDLLKDAVIQGKQASAVVNNLLDFSGSQGSEKHDSDVVAIVDHCLELAEDVISAPSGLHFRDIRIERNYAENVPALECYVAELQQVFLSVLRHACHALGQKRLEEQAFAPRISVEIFDAYDSLWVKIQHNGMALSVEEQQEIFEPFVQHTTPGRPKPLALENRLSFSYFIVTEHHRGEMAVTSAPVVGTTFHIQFNR